MARTTPPRARASRRERPKGPSVKQWNEHRPVGTRVRLRLHPTAEPIETVTRSEAWALGSGEAVVQLEGKSGGYALWSLEVLPPDPAWAFVAKVAQVLGSVSDEELPGAVDQLTTEARALLEARPRA